MRFISLFYLNVFLIKSVEPFLLMLGLSEGDYIYAFGDLRGLLSTVDFTDLSLPTILLFSRVRFLILSKTAKISLNYDQLNTYLFPGKELIGHDVIQHFVSHNQFLATLVLV